MRREFALFTHIGGVTKYLILSKVRPTSATHIGSVRIKAGEIISPTFARPKNNSFPPPNYPPVGGNLKKSKAARACDNLLKKGRPSSKRDNNEVMVKLDEKLGPHLLPETPLKKTAYLSGGKFSNTNVVAPSRDLPLV